MTARKQRPGAAGAAGSVVSIYRPGWKRAAAALVRSAREALGMDHAGFAAYLSGTLGWHVTPEVAGRWERDSTAPGDAVLACDAVVRDAPGAPPGDLIASVPPSFPADVLAGRWVTCYRFDTHAGLSRVHADVATVTALSARQVRIANHPPEPRTEGRAVAFRNEIEAELAGRHLTGQWRNTSDARYYGLLHLAVLPGETVMEGIYTGLASDVAVSAGPWRWVRLDGGDAGDVALREPSALYELVMSRTQDDPPLSLSDIREDDL